VVFLPPETPDLWCFFRQKRLFLISIPSGAIKRKVSSRRHEDLSLFQFLLVRLRGAGPGQPL